MPLVLTAIEQIRYGWALAVTVVVVIGFQAVTLWAAHRNRAPTIRLHLVGGLLVLTLPVLAVASVHAARATMLQAMGSPNSERSAVLSAGISSQINAFPFVISGVMLAVPLWLWAFWTAYRARVGLDEHRPFSRVPLVLLGLYAVAVGGVQWSIASIRAFAALSKVDPEEKVTFLLARLDLARRGLERFAMISSVTILAMVALAVILTVVDRRANRSMPAAEGRGSTRLRVFASVVALGAAIGK